MSHATSTSTMTHDESTNRLFELLGTLFGGGVLVKLVDGWWRRRKSIGKVVSLAENSISSVLEAQKTLTEANASLVKQYEEQIAKLRQDFQQQMYSMSVELTQKLDEEKKRCEAELARVQSHVVALENALKDALSRHGSLDNKGNRR